LIFLILVRESRVFLAFLLGGGWLLGSSTVSSGILRIPSLWVITKLLFSSVQMPHLYYRFAIAAIHTLSKLHRWKQ
jgi:hypothetical protein